MATQPMSTTTLTIQQSRTLLEYAKRCAQICDTDIGSFRSQLLFRDKAYQRSLNVTAEQIKSVRSTLSGTKRVVGNMEVPIIMPQIESATAYQTGVFCSSYPIFGVIADQKSMPAATQFETVLGQQSQRYGWVRELIKIFRDGAKYNFGVGVVQWQKENLQKLVTSVAPGTAGMAALQGYSYGGNRIKHVSPYNCFMDTRVAPCELHTDGEFFGYNELYSKIKLKRFLQALDSTKTKNFKEAYESQYAGGSTSDGAMDIYIPKINPYTSMGDVATTATDWNKWAGLTSKDGRINYSDNYVVTHFFCRATPSDFGAPGDIPQIYHAIFVNWKHCVYVDRQVAAHDFLPAVIMQPNEDGLGYQTQSMLDNSLSFQDMSSALWEITLEGKRRQIFDRLIYNPSLIDPRHIDPASSVARIPLRNAKLSKEDTIARAVYQIPYRNEDGMSGVQLAQAVGQMADEAAGQNKVSRGQFQKGNKTVPEFETTQQNSNSRQQLSALTIEYQFMTPVKEMIKSNTLQNQTPTSILNKDTKNVIEVNPVELRRAMLEFTMTDGVLPMEKIMNSEIMMVFLQTAQALPVLMSEYDITGMFVQWARLHGAKWLDEFKRDPAGQQQFLQLQQQAQLANDPSQQAQLMQAQAQQQAAQQGAPA